MKALILVGGFGTRLRPLTFSKPKPLVEFCNKPIVLHQIEALAKVGVTEVVLAINYKPETMRAGLEAIAAEYGVKITCSKEDEPMGTAGPLALAREHLVDGDEPFFVFNSDVTCVYPLRELLEFHKAHGGEGTICVTKVSEPSKYGVVVHDDAGKIMHFVEKPQTFVGNHINAGLYIFNPSILDRIPLRPTSIEKEIFPAMADASQLYAMELPRYWMDIGQPRDYLTGMCLHLEARKGQEGSGLAEEGDLDRSEAGVGGGLGGGGGGGGGDMLTPAPSVPEVQVSRGASTVIGSVLIDPSARIGAGCVLGPDVVIGPGCVVEDGARIVRSTVLGGARVCAHALVSSSIVGWASTVGRWCRVENVSVLGEDVTVKDEICLNGAAILPHKGIKESVYTPGTIVM